MAVDHAALWQTTAAWRGGRQENAASMAVDHAAEWQTAATWREGRRSVIDQLILMNIAKFTMAVPMTLQKRTFTLLNPACLLRKLISIRKPERSRRSGRMVVKCPKLSTALRKHYQGPKLSTAVRKHFERIIYLTYPLLINKCRSIMPTQTTHKNHPGNIISFHDILFYQPRSNLSAGWALEVRGYERAKRSSEGEISVQTR